MADQRGRTPVHSVGPGGLQLVPRTGMPGTDAQVYAPHRDLAHNFSSLLEQAMHGLRPENQEEWFAELIELVGLSGDDLGKAMVAFVKAVPEFALPGCKSPHEALTRHGFFETPWAAQFVMAAKFGQVVYGAVFSAVRDVTAAGERPPMQEGINKIVEEALATAAVLGGQSPAAENDA